MTLDDDSAIVTLPPSPPESPLLVGRAPSGARHPYNGAGIRLRHEQPMRHVLLEVAVTAASVLGIEIANWSSSIRWSMEA
jgi:hypothetical protein